VAIPPDRNVVKKEAEKKLKYKSLSIGIQRMWNHWKSNEKLKEESGSYTRENIR
jgi:hypothetical protein